MLTVEDPDGFDPDTGPTFEIELDPEPAYFLPNRFTSYIFFFKKIKVLTINVLILLYALDYKYCKKFDCRLILTHEDKHGTGSDHILKTEFDQSTQIRPNPVFF